MCSGYEGTRINVCSRCDPHFGNHCPLSVTGVPRSPGRGSGNHKWRIALDRLTGPTRSSHGTSNHTTLDSRGQDKSSTSPLQSTSKDHIDDKSWKAVHATPVICETHGVTNYSTTVTDSDAEEHLGERLRMARNKEAFRFCLSDSHRGEHASRKQNGFTSENYKFFCRLKKVPASNVRSALRPSHQPVFLGLSRGVDLPSRVVNSGLGTTLMLV